MEQNIPKRNLPRDVFLHLLAIVTLYWSAVSFVTLLWQYINYFFPDVLTPYYNYMGFSGPIRFAIASLIIVFPVFIAVSWYLNRIYAREAGVRESKIRKWLIYLTLFITSIVIIGDLVSTMNIFLGGEITIRFFLKALSIIVVAGVVFTYYLNDVRSDMPTKLAKPFAIATSVVIFIFVVGAFFIVGSPATARLMQFDQQKIMDLQGIQSQIVYYWQRKETMPNFLEDMKDPISSYIVPKDPQTGTDYEYRIVNLENLSFELCANFNRDGKDQYIQKSPNAHVMVFTAENWGHPAGFYCFQRTIDKDLYPPIKK